MADDLDLAGLACDIQSRSHAADAASGDVDALQVRVTVAVFQRVFECLVLTVLIFLDIYDVEIRITGRQLFLEAFQSALVAGQAGGADDESRNQKRRYPCDISERGKRYQGGRYAQRRI